MASPFSTSRQAIETPSPATPPRYGLLFVANEVNLGDDWPNGVKWAPEQTGGGGIVGLDCHGSTDTMDPADTNPTVTTADPFIVWAEDHCSTMGWQARDFEGRVRRQLEATQSFHVAGELWLGTQAQSDSLDNEWLTDDPKILTGAAVTPTEALALIEQGLGEMLFGRRGMVHVSPQVLTELAAAFSIQLNGQLWLTAMGNLVVADAGYPGDGPDSGAGSTHQWMYATPPVQYHLGVPDIPPMNTGGDIVQQMNRAINDIVLYAAREAILVWDWNIPIGTSGKTGVLAAETTTAAFAAL